MFCEHCGKELKENETCNCMNSEDCAGEVTVQPVQTETQKEKKLKPWMLGVGIVAMILVIAMLLSSKKEKVDLATYINTNPEIYGLNGTATIEISELFDSSAFENDILKSISGDGSTDLENMSEEEFEEALFGVGESFLECEQALDDIKVQVWKDGEEVTELTNLSNGMKIKVQVSSANPVNKTLKKEFKTGTAEFKIENLIEAQEIDIFKIAEVTVTFSGINGDGVTEIEWNEDALPELSYSFIAEEGWNCSNGDEKTILLKYDETEWESLGCYPKETYKRYTVEGLPECLTDVNEIPDDVLLEFVEQAMELIEEVEEEDGYNFEGLQTVCFMTKRDGLDESETDVKQNMLVFEGTMTGFWGELTVYVLFSNLWNQGSEYDATEVKSGSCAVWVWEDEWEEIQEFYDITEIDVSTLLSE